MEWIQITARTIEDAKEMALDRLGVDEADLEFEVLEEPRAGFLGVGRSDARIRARVRPVSREKPDTRRRERRRDGGRGPRRGRREPGGRDERRSAAVSRTEHVPKQSKPAPPTRQEPAVSDADVPEMTEADLEEQCGAAVDFVSGLLDAFDVDGDVHGRVDDDRIEVSVAGEGLGVLIGPSGATLSAIEEVTHSVVQRSTGGHSARIRVDVGGYRERRRAALEEFAREVAKRARETGEVQSLEPMSSSDRKVVHDAVAEIDGVVTTSEGVEPRRRVVIRRA
jgi:spoIIIJ-associated protein